MAGIRGAHFLRLVSLIIATHRRRIDVLSCLSIVGRAGAGKGGTRGEKITWAGDTDALIVVNQHFKQIGVAGVGDDVFPRDRRANFDDGPARLVGVNAIGQLLDSNVDRLTAKQTQIDVHALATGAHRNHTRRAQRVGVAVELNVDALIAFADAIRRRYHVLHPIIARLQIAKLEIAVVVSFEHLPRRHAVGRQKQHLNACHALLVSVLHAVAITIKPDPVTDAGRAIKTRVNVKASAGIAHVHG